jgi:hypothetical protein
MKTLLLSRPSAVTASRDDIAPWVGVGSQSRLGHGGDQLKHENLGGGEREPLDADEPEDFVIESDLRLDSSIDYLTYSDDE